MNERRPTFILAGAVKSGTSSLYGFLDQHPQVFMSPVKEPHFFSSADMDFSAFRPLIRERVEAFNLQQYLDSPMKKKVYRAYVTSWEDYLKLFKNAGKAIALGEASTSYLWSPSAPGAIREKIPDVKIIILLRNPVQRAFSHYLMDVKNNLTRLSFAEALREDLAVTGPSWGKNSMYVETGLYAARVKRYQQVFPPEQLLIILLDDLKQDPSVTLKSIFRFIGVDPEVEMNLKIRRNVATLPANRFVSMLYNNLFVRKYVSGPLGDKLKEPLKKIFFKTAGLPVLAEAENQYLSGLFEKDIHELQLLIKRDLSTWLSA